MKNNLRIIVEQVGSHEEGKIFKKYPLEKHYSKSYNVVKLPSSGSFYAVIEEFKKEVDAQDNKQNIERDKLNKERKTAYLLNEKLRKDLERRVNEFNARDFALERKKIEEKVALNYKDIRWIWCTIDGKLNFDSDDHNLDYAEGATGAWFTIPKVLEGGGLVYLEAFRKTDVPSNGAPIGVFVRADGKPKIVAVEWRVFQNDNKGQKINPETKLPFGDTIQLHIYTEGLYGQEIEIQLMNDDWSDDKLPAFERKDGVALDKKPEQETPDMPQNTFFVREVKTERLKEGESIPSTAVTGMLNANEVKAKNQANLNIQKSVVNVYLDPFWKVKPFADAETIKLYAKVKYDGAEDYKTFGNDYISIVGREIISELTPVGNKAVLVGTIETDDANFRPCRYNKIELKQQEKAGSTVVFDSADIEQRKKPSIDIEIVAGKKEVYLVDFEIESEECSSKPKHSHKEILITSYPKDLYVAEADASTKAAHIIKNESKLAKSELKSSASHQIFGGLKSDQKIDIYKEIGNFKIREKQLEFDGFYNYDINFGLGAASAMVDIMKYFWLPNLEDKIPKFEGSVTTCAFRKPLNIKIFPDIKWSLTFGFNVEEEQLKTLMPSWDQEKTIQKFEWKAEKFSQKNFKNGTSDADRKKINDTALGEFERVYGKPKEKNKAEDDDKKKGKLSTLLEIMKDVDVSLKAQIYEDNELELTRDFFENSFNSQIYKDVYTKVSWAVDMISGKKDQAKDKLKGDAEIAKYLRENELTKRTKNLREALTREPQEVEIIFPKVSLAGDWNYEAVDGEKYPLMNGRVGLAYNIALIAKPFIGIEIKWHILDLLCRRHPVAYAVLAAVKTLLAALGDNPDGIKVELWVKGEIDASLKFGGNYLVGNKHITSEGEAHITAGVEIGITLKASAVWGKYEAVAVAGIGGKGEVGLGLKGSVGVDDRGIWLQTSLIFDGIKLSFEGVLGAVIYEEVIKKDGTVEKKEVMGKEHKIEGEIALLNHTLETDKFYFD